MNNKTKYITNSAILAAILAVSSIINRTYTGHGTAIAEFLGATKETQFYIIPLSTWYFVGKFGKANGMKTALSGTLVGLTVAWVTGTTGGKGGLLDFSLNYIIPWSLCTLVGLAPRDSKGKIALATTLCWIGVIVSWGIAGVLYYVPTFKTAVTWSVIKYNGWLMFITMPLFLILFNSKSNTITK